MAKTDFERVFETLARARVRYLVAGGVAVVLHGHPRFTADLDLIFALDPPNVRRAMRALGRLGYRPRAPVKAGDLADPKLRFSLWSPRIPGTEVDCFVREPRPFRDMYAARKTLRLGSLRIPVEGMRRVRKAKARTGWRRHEEEQRRAWLALTPLRRLQLLDQAKRLVALARKSVSSDERSSARSPRA